MKVFILIAGCFALAKGGVITHDLAEDDGHHEKAISYQDILFEHFHAVPTYIKKEHLHLLQHPIPAGKSASKIKVHHGGKHDHGYAFVEADNDVHGAESKHGISSDHLKLPSHDFSNSGGVFPKALIGHAALNPSNRAALYQVQGENSELLHQQAMQQMAQGYVDLQAYTAALSQGGGHYQVPAAQGESQQSYGEDAANGAAQE